MVHKVIVSIIVAHTNDNVIANKLCTTVYGIHEADSQRCDHVKPQRNAYSRDTGKQSLGEC